MSKWKVEGITSRYYRAPRCWDVYDPNGGFWRSFDTHAEALAYADEKARTITATLPRVGETVTIPSQHDAKDEPPLLVRFTNRMTWIYQHSDDYNDFIVLDVDHLEPLALALLAHAERMEE